MGARGAIQIGSGFLVLDDVRTVVQGDHADPDHPRKLTVSFRDGKSLTFNYPTAEDRDRFFEAIVAALGGGPEFGPLGRGHVRLSDVAAVERRAPPGFAVRVSSRAGAVVAEAEFGTEEERDAAYGALLGLLGGSGG